MDTRALGGEFFTKGRNPCSRNENSNTIYSSDPAHGSDGAEVHSRPEREEATKRQLRSGTVSIMYWVVKRALAQRSCATL